MRAAGATILPFPTPARLVLEARDRGRREAPPDTASPAAARVGEAPTGAAAWAPGLLLLAPLLLSPQAGTARDAVAALLAALVFCLASWAARRGAGAPPDPREAAVAGLAALAGAAALGPAVAVPLLLFGLLEAARPALGRKAPLLLAATVPLRLDAGFAALGHGVPPLLLAAGMALGLFLALAATPPTAPRRFRPWRDLALLAFAALSVSLYAAALLADPWIQRAAGVWPLASAPLVLLALLRLWRPRGGGAAPDHWLAAAVVGWAIVLALTLPAATL